MIWLEKRWPPILTVVLEELLVMQFREIIHIWKESRETNRFLQTGLDREKGCCKLRVQTKKGLYEKRFCR